MAEEGREPRIALRDVLGHISEQIRALDLTVRKDGVPVMVFKECEVEFAVEIESAGTAGVTVYVVKLGGGVKKTESNTVKIKYVALPEVDFVGQAEGLPGAVQKPSRASEK